MYTSFCYDSKQLAVLQPKGMEKVVLTMSSCLDHYTIYDVGDQISACVAFSSLVDTSYTRKM